MKQDELLKQLARYGIPREFYAVNVIAPTHEAYVMMQIPGGWSVYYSERGMPSDELRFQTEHEACVEMCRRLIGDTNLLEDIRRTNPGSKEEHRLHARELVALAIKNHELDRLLLGDAPYHLSAMPSSDIAPHPSDVWNEVTAYAILHSQNDPNELITPTLTKLCDNIRGVVIAAIIICLETAHRARNQSPFTFDLEKLERLRTETSRFIHASIGNTGETPRDK